MNEKQFYNWLCERYTGGTPDSRLANCRRVEQYEGDLDTHFAKDQGKSLLIRLAYSAEDRHNGRRANHRIPINGDVYNGTATLKHATKLYFEFKSGTVTKNTLVPNNPK